MDPVAARTPRAALVENADALLVFSFFLSLPTQSEERKRIDELIESGKEEGMKVRGHRAYRVEAEAVRSCPPWSRGPVGATLP